MLILDPVAVDLSILRQLWSGAPSEVVRCGPTVGRRLRRRRVAHRRVWRDGLRHQHRLRPPRAGAYSRRASGRAAAQSHSLAQLRAGRGDTASRHPANDRAQAARPRARAFRGPARRGRGAAGVARCRCDAGHPLAGFGRRIGRPCSAGAYDGRADGARLDRFRRRASPRCVGVGADGAGPARTRPQGRLGADQRDAIQHRRGARCAVRGGAGVRRRASGRGACGRCVEGQHQAVRRPHLGACAASRGRSASRANCRGCSTARRSSPRTIAAAGCRIPTASAASRR